MAQNRHRYHFGLLIGLILMSLLSLGCTSQRAPVVMEAPVYSYLRSGDANRMQPVRSSVSMTLEPPGVSTARR
jgi:hypothetical protein